MANAAPYEIISAPGVLYHGNVGRSFPAPHTTPNTSHWTKIGESRDLNYTRDGVTVTMNQTVNPWRSLGDPGARKLFRSEEQLMVRANVADMKPDVLALLVQNAVGGSGSNPRHLPLSRVYDLKKFALLVRFDASPTQPDGASQYELPQAVITSSPEPVYRGGDEPVALAVEFEAIADTSAGKADRFGRYVSSIPHATVRLGTSANATPISSELNVGGTNGTGTIQGYSGNRYVLVARLESEPDINHIFYTSSGSPNLNRIGSFTKFGSVVAHTGNDYEVWVSNSPQTHATALTIAAA